jgi:hypothetical protein
MACRCIWLAGSEEEPSQGTKIIIVHSRMASICAHVLCCFWLLSLLYVLPEESRLYGLQFLTSFWNMSKRIVHGHSSVQMKLQVSQTSGVMNLRVYMSSTRKRCTPSQSLNDMPCQDMSNFWDLIAPSQRYLTSSTLSQGTAKKRFKLKSYDLQYCRPNWDWQFLHALQGTHHLFWMAGIVWPLCHMQWQQWAERWTESMLCGMMSLFDFANHVPSIPGCMQQEKQATKSWYHQVI